MRAAFSLSSQLDTDTTVGDDNAANLQPSAHAGSSPIGYGAGWDTAERGARGCGAFREKTLQAPIRTQIHMRLG